ncbi:MAG: hypothetical protein ACI9AD_001263, partial [Nitriliruptoraceae bacterium]
GAVTQRRVIQIHRSRHISVERERNVSHGRSC